MQKEVIAGRPVIFDYKNPSEFLQALVGYYKNIRRGFSIRSRSKKVNGCSPALISQILKGQRKLKRDHLQNFTEIFSLNSTEVQHIDELLKADQKPSALEFIKTNTSKIRNPKNHLLSDWLNPYVKDLVELENFELDSKWMLRNLGFATNLNRIERSVQFLLREGFWRKSSDGRVVPEELAVTTTNEIPNEKIRDFHLQALKIAAQGVKNLSVQRRKASAVLVAVNSDTKNELKGLIDKFQNDLLKFIEKHPANKEELVQITVHMTPIGGSLENF